MTETANRSVGLISLVLSILMFVDAVKIYNNSPAVSLYKGSSIESIILGLSIYYLVLNVIIFIGVLCSICAIFYVSTNTNKYAFILAIFILIMSLTSLVIYSLITADAIKIFRQETPTYILQHYSNKNTILVLSTFTFVATIIGCIIDICKYIKK